MSHNQQRTQRTQRGNDRPKVRFNDFQARLNACYNKIKNSRLVSNGDTDNDSLNYFTRFLNQSLPMSYSEREQSNIWKDIYFANFKEQFDLMYRGGRSNNSSKYVLLLNGDTIAKHFNIAGCVKISWDRNLKGYQIEPIFEETKETKETNDNEDNEDNHTNDESSQ